MGAFFICKVLTSSQRGQTFKLLMLMVFENQPLCITNGYYQKLSKLIMNGIPLTGKLITDI